MILAESESTMNKTTGYENLTIDHPMMEAVKSSLNLSLVQAIDAAVDRAKSTVTLKIDIESLSDGMSMIEEAPKELMPIEFTCNVSSKKKVSDMKGLVFGMVTKHTSEGMVAKNADEDQVSLFDGDGHDD